MVKLVNDDRPPDAMRGDRPMYLRTLTDAQLKSGIASIGNERDPFVVAATAELKRRATKETSVDQTEQF